MKIRYFFVLLISLYFITLNLYANDPLVLFDLKRDHNASKNLRYFFDNTNSLNVSDLLGNNELIWSNNKNKDSLSLGFNTNNLWINFDVINICCETENWYLELGYPPIDYIHFYQITEDGKITEVQDGDLTPTPKNAIRSKFFNFKIKVPYNGKVKIFLKIRSDSSLALPLNLYSAEGFAEKILLEEYFFGIFSGIMLIMALYNLFLYFSIKENSYLYYIMYIISFLLQSLSLRGYIRLFFPEWVYLNNIAPILFTELSLFFGLNFTSSFLLTKQYLPRIHKLLLFYMIVPFIGICLVIFTTYTIAIKFATATSFLCSFLLLISGYASFKNNFRPARFFILGWGMISIGMILFALRMAGILPHNLFTNSSYQIFSILEILLLSLALGDKINIFKKEFSSNLEIKVTERTRELSAMIEIVNEQKKEVELTLEELKNTQAQLVESEKKASLGQLVSVVAHEINNPIGAIQASSEIAEISFNSILSDFIPFIRSLDSNQLKHFNDLLRFSIDSITYSSTRTERNIKKMIKIELEEYKSNDTNTINKINELLSELKLIGKFNTYIKYFSEKELLTVLENIRLFVTEFRSLKYIDLSVQKTSKVIFVLRKYLSTDIIGEKKIISINEQIDKVLELYDNYINDNIKIEKSFAVDTTLNCIADDLIQVWRNLILNSIQSMQSTDKNLIIITKRISENEKEIIQITITDSGIGIEENNFSNIFKPFYTTKPIGEGIGLGLYTCKTIIEEHGGSIEFQSEKNNTTFIIKLPIII
jgi:two-component system, NtrC family, sensor kinase